MPLSDIRTGIVLNAEPIDTSRGASANDTSARDVGEKSHSTQTPQRAIWPSDSDTYRRAAEVFSLFPLTYDLYGDERNTLIRD